MKLQQHKKEQLTRLVVVRAPLRQNMKKQLNASISTLAVKQSNADVYRIINGTFSVLGVGQGKLICSAHIVINALLGSGKFLTSKKK
jgi:hypothetical protein